MKDSNCANNGLCTHSKCRDKCLNGRNCSSTNEICLNMGCYPTNCIDDNDCPTTMSCSILRNVCVHECNNKYDCTNDDELCIKGVCVSNSKMNFFKLIYKRALCILNRLIFFYKVCVNGKCPESTKCINNQCRRKCHTVKDCGKYFDGFCYNNEGVCYDWNCNHDSDCPAQNYKCHSGTKRCTQKCNSNNECSQFETFCFEGLCISQTGILKFEF